jgi:hypothetical protein
MIIKASVFLLSVELKENNKSKQPANQKVPYIKTTNHQQANKRL